MFKITIEETKTVTKIAGKEWAVIGTREVARDRAYVNEDEAITRVEDVHGYTPEIEKTVEVTTVILTQQVETLDLAEVIKAINNL